MWKTLEGLQQNVGVHVHPVELVRELLTVEEFPVGAEICNAATLEKLYTTEYFHKLAVYLNQPSIFHNRDSVRVHGKFCGSEIKC